MHRPGDKVKVTYLRKKKEYTTTLTLRNEQGTTGNLETVDTESMGAALRVLTDDEKRELGLRNGLLVSSIKAGKLQDAGITKGIIIMQVNDLVMSSVQDFEEAVKAANRSSDRVLWIRAKTQSGLNRSFTVELGDAKNKNKALQIKRLSVNYHEATNLCRAPCHTTNAEQTLQRVFAPLCFTLWSRAVSSIL